MSARVFTEYAVVCDEHGSQIIRIDKAEDAQWLADEHNRLLAHNSADSSDAERQRVYESMRRVDDELERQDPHADEQSDCGGWEDH